MTMPGARHDPRDPPPAARVVVLPLGRIGRDRRLSTDSLDQQLAHVAHEPGVREQL